MRNPFYPWIPEEWFIREPPKVVMHKGKLYVKGELPNKEIIVQQPERYRILIRL